MCTLSICLDFARKNTLVTMNRDEAREREQENEPGFHWNNDTYAPQDPVGGGTWIAANSDGYYAALLNAYGESNYKPKNPQSRGQIIPYLLNSTDPLSFIDTMDLSPYPGFKLVVGYRLQQPQLLSWDGQKIIRKKFHGFHDSHLFFQTSSSIEQDNIINLRVNRFNHWAKSGQVLTSDNIPDFHVDTQPDSSSAILMSRPQSVTKSVTSISIGDDITMSYFAVKSNKVSLTKSYSFHGKK